MSVLRSYLSCHQQPPLANAPDQPPSVEDLDLVQEPIPPEAVLATPAKARILTRWDDLNDLEKRVFRWLKAHGLVEPYQVAAGLSLPLDTVQPVLDLFDRFCLILKCDHQIALNLHAKQQFVESETVATTNDPRIVAIEADAIRLEETNGQREVVVQHFYNPKASQRG